MKKVATTYTCDLCEKEMGERPRHRIPLAHDAVCDLCTACAHTHLPLIQKLGALVRAASPPNPYAQYNLSGSQQWWGGNGT